VSSRLIFIGDIHGCIDELRELLQRVAPSRDDVVVALGDTVNKGPDPVAVVDLIVSHRFRALRGNKEEELIEHSRSAARRLVALDGERAMLKRPDLIDAIERWSLWLDFEEHGILAVHGGVLPLERVTAKALGKQSDTLPKLRYIRRERDSWSAVPKGRQRDGDPFWTDAWKGDRTVVYGHTPRREVKRTKRTIGLDTGCVYGGSLSAAVHDPDDGWTIVTVPARRRYAS
jgi:predicted phosphodiesterase